MDIEGMIFGEGPPAKYEDQHFYDELIRDNFGEVGLHSLLVQAAKQKRTFAESTGPRQGRAATRLVEMLLEAVVMMAGRDVIAAAYGGHDLASAEDRTNVLHSTLPRLLLASKLFKSVEAPGGSGSLTALLQEVLAVANGDAPRLLARIGGREGKLTNKYRSSLHRLRALQWDRALEAWGISPGTRHLHIGGAFGAQWTRILGWRGQVEEALGQGFVEMMLDWSDQGLDPVFCDPAIRKNYEPFLAQDGRAFLDEEKARVPAPRRSKKSSAKLSR